MRIQVPKSPASFLLTIFLAAVCWAQATNGNIRGTVSDQTGAVLPKATVIVKSVGTGAERRVSTNEDGVYLADNLPPGEY
ncbi:MAG: carboxypeptidase-like regulatory domain-containing protein [Blastocatellia bacterium]